MLAIEELKRLIDVSIREGILPGFKAMGSDVDISLLQFTNDTLCFLPVDELVLPNFIRILCCFELISGLSINYHKSSIIRVNASDTLLHSCARFIDCRVEHFSYCLFGKPS